MAEDARLMFLASKYFEQGKAIRGASLVTDQVTRPIEFRCTSPIRPNAYQRMLYGDTLDEYIFVDLIGVPLITGVRESVNVVLIEDERFLSARPRVDVPVLLLARSMEGVDAALVSLKACSGFESERAALEPWLLSLFANRDLLEPFQRVHLALDQAHAEKVGDKGA